VSGLAPTIETARLRMRGWTAADRPRWREICADPEVMRHIRTGVPLTAAEADEQVDRFRVTWAQHGFGLWALERLDRPGCIGFCGNIPIPGGGVEIGWRLARGEWGQGLATEAAIPARDWAFANIAIDRLYAHFRPDNLASQRVMEKLGMSFSRDTIDEHGLSMRIYVLERPPS
jgi:RimJ/RimL family protein N-acetyltransferase